MSDQERTSSSGSRQPGGSAPATTPGGTGGDGALDLPMGGHITEHTGAAGSTGMPETTGSSGMGGGGSGGDSATGTGAPPGAGGPSGQPVAPAPTRSKPVAGGREPGAAGAREDSEAGGAVGAVGRESRAGGESARRKRGDYPADAGSVGDVKVAEDILGSVLGDREPDESEPPRRNPP
jgi:DNA polymerase-3 subunit gamma/tau